MTGARRSRRVLLGAALLLSTFASEGCATLLAEHELSAVGRPEPLDRPTFEGLSVAMVGTRESAFVTLRLGDGSLRSYRDDGQLVPVVPRGRGVELEGNLRLLPLSENHWDGHYRYQVFVLFPPDGSGVDEAPRGRFRRFELTCPSHAPDDDSETRGTLLKVVVLPFTLAIDLATLPLQAILLVYMVCTGDFPVMVSPGM